MSERKGVWIPAAIWDYSDLSLQQKLILCEINSLDQNGECFAKNAYFAEFLGLSITRISRIISALDQLGYIKIHLHYQGKHVTKRTISVVRQVDSSIDLTPCENATPPCENAQTPCENAHPPCGNDKGINTPINTIYNSTLAPLNFDHVNDFAIQEGLTSVNTFRFFNTYKKTNWLSVNGNPINWRERLREWDIDDAKNKQQNKGSTPTGSYKSSDPFTIYDHEPF